MVLKWIFIVSLMLSGRAWAFPEMVRHGYTQCTSCHVSPAGGGILTTYGRDLSAEILSTWSYENEAQFTHTKIGKDLSDSGILVGGDVRGVETYMKAPGTEQAQTFLMMADLQGAYQTGKFTGVLSVGELTRVGQGGIHGDFNSTEYYGMVNMTDQIAVRAGRFRPAYGINFPDHTLDVKSDLFGTLVPRFDYDAVEASYLSDNWTILAGAARALPNVRTAKQESVRTLNVDYSFLNSMRAGLSYWDGQGPVLDRHMIGAHAILGFTKHFYNMTELDYKYEEARNGEFGLTQFGYELCKGVTPYLQYQREQDNLSMSGTVSDTYGAGFHFYPRPHLELSGEWDHIRSSTVADADSAYLLAHYYF